MARHELMESARIARRPISMSFSDYWPMHFGVHENTILKGLKGGCAHASSGEIIPAQGPPPTSRRQVEMSQRQCAQPLNYSVAPLLNEERAS
jgi:hypothetical protein